MSGEGAYKDGRASNRVCEGSGKGVVGVDEVEFGNVSSAGILWWSCPPDIGEGRAFCGSDTVGVWAFC